MERIRNYLKSFDGKPINAQKMMYDCDSKWGQLNTGLPFDMDTAAALIDEYIKGRVGEAVVPVDLPIVLTKEESDSIAKALGVENTKEAICAAAVSAALKEAPLKG